MLGLVRKPGDRFVFGVLLLAAGRSRRMGKPKLLLPWGTGSVLAHLVRQWKDLGAAQIAVVSAADARDIHAELDRIGFAAKDCICNPAPERGMFSSIQCGAAWPGWKEELTHIVVALGDQPHLKPQTLWALIDFGRDHLSGICQPSRRGHARHPVLMPAFIFFKLKDAGAADFKAVLDEHAALRAGFECSDPGLDLDLDTPEDYERAKALQFG